MVLSHRYFRILVNSNGIFFFGFVLYSFLPTSSDIIWHFRSKISHLIYFIWCVGYLHSSLWNWANNMHLTEAIKLLIKICIVKTLPPKQSPHWLLSMAILAQSRSPSPWRQTPQGHSLGLSMLKLHWGCASDLGGRHMAIRWVISICPAFQFPSYAFIPPSSCAFLYIHPHWDLADILLPLNFPPAILQAALIFHVLNNLVY